LLAFLLLEKGKKQISVRFGQGQSAPSMDFSLHKARLDLLSWRRGMGEKRRDSGSECDGVGGCWIMYQIG
jgi:hypothetical protein